MKPVITSVTNPRWSNIERTKIDCEVTVQHLGAEVLPFTAQAIDPEEHGRDLFVALLRGDHGPIAAYIPPDADVLATNARNTRDILLAETDWTQAGDAPQATKDKWAAYRQALRDVPQQPSFPSSIVWPSKP